MTSYSRPATLDAALAFLAAHADLTILAGGTDIFPARTQRQAWGNMSEPNILDISALDDLRGVEDRGDHWWLGALTTWSDIIAAPLPQIFDGLKDAAREVGGIQIQNRGTIGGNCCTASPAGDGIPCLMALDAEFEIAGPRPRRLPAVEFFTGYRRTALTSGELVTGVRVPKQAGRSAFRKLGARRYLVISIAMIAAVVELDSAGRVAAAKLAVGSCAATAQRLTDLERTLTGRVLDAALIEPAHFSHLAPIDDIRGSATYRRHAACALTRDIIAGLAETHRGEVEHEC